MPDQMSNKLGAYLDGELDRRAQSEVQTHLETCPACQDELEELRRLSHLLRAAPQPDFTPAARLQDRFMLQLPRRDADTPLSAQTAGCCSGWRLHWSWPAGFFIQVTLGLSTLILLASQAGFLDGAAAWAAAARSKCCGSRPPRPLLADYWASQGQAGLSSSMMPACSPKTCSSPCSGRLGRRCFTGAL